MKKLLRLLALLLSVLLLFTTIPLSVFALESSTTAFAGGDGTENNPYQISTPEQLNAIRNNLSASYVLINDIDLNNWGNWEPIGVGDSLYGITPPANPPKSDYQPFTGIFDGGNYSVRNLKINDYEVSYVSDCHGLFSAVDGGVIKNLKLIDVSITINKSSTDYAQIHEEHRGVYAVYTGGIVGEATDTKIDNCYVSGSINVAHCDDAFVGGISGNGVATNCISDVSISVNNVTSVWCGGIIGHTQAVNSKISECINYGNITAYSNGFVYVGGITGEYGLISDCVNFGDVEGKVVEPSSGYSSFAGVCNVGGIVGATSSDYVKNSVNYGCVSAYLDCTGISNYGNTYSHAYAGGIVGYCGFYGSGFVNQCYNISQTINCVKISNTGTTITQNAGRISGYSIKNSGCFSVAETSVNNNTISSSLNTSNDGQDIGKEACLIKETYANFDFENIWEIDETIGGATLKLGFDDILSDNPIKPGSSIEQLYFIEPIVILDIGESKSLGVHSRYVANINGELVYSNDTVVNASDIDWNAELYKDSGIIKIDDNGQITGLSEGYEHILVNSKNDFNLSTFCHVYVGDPNDLHYTSTYDTKQYYADGGFYSEVSSISDCVEIYILLENKLKEAVANISGIDETIAQDTEKETFKDIKPITLTASVNGTGLSFDRDTYQNTYTVTLDEVPLTNAVNDILMLFPHNLNVASSGNNYTVKVTLESESFETITDEYSFAVENLETKSANEHIDFISSNKDYKVSKQNIYGETMVTLKNDAEYKWSKYSTLDFDNYYEIVLADVIISMLQVNQVEIHSLVSSVLKEWRGTYKTLLGGITTIVEDNYAGQFGNTERKIDKLLKKSKYETDGIYVKDELYETVMDLLGNTNNANKINNVFKAMDKTGQVFGMVNLGGNILSDAVDWGNKISIFNAYANADNEFKTVIKSFADSIPESEKKMREAIYDYVNYAESDSGQISELLESFSGLMKNVTLDVFSSCVGGRMIDYLGVQLVNWVGTATVGGVAFSTTATFATVKTTLGSISTGVTLGLCFSDLICDSSGKAAEMGKVVAMSEFSPYVIQTLLHYENKLKEDKNISATTYYEYAFALHKATQSYIMQHTINSLETKRDSLIIRIFNRDDYDGLISDILAQKRTIDNLYCHSSISTSTVVTKTKVIAIKCPVNVFVYDESGKEVVRIVNDIKEHIAEGIDVFVEDSEKYIALPTNQKYSVRIIAVDSGTMEYTVTEYGTGAERLRTIKKGNIPLVSNREFTGQIVVPINVTPETYALTYGDEIAIPDKVVEYKVGDVNLDGDISILDATEIQRHLAKITSLSDDAIIVADANRDGEVSIIDATHIQRFLAKLIPNLDQTKTVSSISVYSNPTKTIYYVGESLDASGLELKLAYSDGSFKTISSGFECSPTDLSSTDIKEITVAYKGKTTKFAVTVKPNELESIKVKNMPLKTTYVVGDPLEAGGLTLTATYSNGSSKTVDRGYSVSPSTLSTVGTQTITVSWGGKKTTFTVTVEPKGISYSISGNTLTISGNGKMSDYSYFNAPPWQSQMSSIKNIVIESGVTKIGDFAFNGSAISSIAIPSSVTAIGRYAFYNCRSLTSITIPKSVTTMGDNVFSGCHSMTNMTVASGNPTFHSSGNCIIETANKTLFSGCKNSNIPTDGSVTCIGANAFSDCTNLSSISIPGTIKRIESNAFSGCTSITSMTIPNGVTFIGNYAFAHCESLYSISIPASVKTIGYSTFYWCTSLRYATFANKTGWYITETEGASTGTSVSVDSDWTAAVYLRDTYIMYYWYCQ